MGMRDIGSYVARMVVCEFAVLSESVPLVMSRALITNISECMPSLPKELQQILCQLYGISHDLK